MAARHVCTWFNCWRPSWIRRTKDIDFSPVGIKRRWEAGYMHTKAALASEPWRGHFDTLSGVILHEAKEVTSLVAE